MLHPQNFLPRALNNLGTVFGGDLLEWMDSAATACASHFTRNPHMITIAMDRVFFHKPIVSTDVLELRATVAYCRRHSLQVREQTPPSQRSTRASQERNKKNFPRKKPPPVKMTRPLVGPSQCLSACYTLTTCLRPPQVEVEVDVLTPPWLHGEASDQVKKVHSHQGRFHVLSLSEAGYKQPVGVGLALEGDVDAIVRYAKGSHAYHFWRKQSGSKKSFNRGMFGDGVCHMPWGGVVGG